jgi:hypothetical protein
MDRIIGRSYTLMSNASLKEYPDNTASSFTVVLPQHQSFNENWVVGLVEIHFPLSFESDEGEKDGEKKKKNSEQPVSYTFVSLDDVSSGKHVKPILPQEENLTVEKGQRVKRTLAKDVTPASVEPAAKKVRGDSAQSEESEEEEEGEEEGKVIQRSNGGSSLEDQETPVPPECSKVVQECEDDFRNAEYDYQQVLLRKGHKLSVCKAEKKSEIEKYEARIQELVVKHEAAVRDLEKKVAEGSVTVNYWKENFVSLAHMAYRDANQMNNSRIPKYLQIYCDIVQRRMIGNTFGNFLHTERVPPIRINGDTCEGRYQPPQYHRLGKYNFDRIEIAIRDEKGRLVRFKKGTVTMITLHFKSVC